MRLARLQARGFRNLADDRLDVDAPMVAFTGDNGAGKTNLLEAVAMLGALRSFRTVRASELVRWGEHDAHVQAVGTSEGMTRSWTWSVSAGARTLTLDERNVGTDVWVRTLRATWFVPTDVGIVRGEPALRRMLLDRAVFTSMPAYLGPARALRRVLDQKAALLRSGGADDVQLDVIDTQLATVGAAVMAARRDFLARMQAPFARAHAAFAGEADARAVYAPWHDGAESVPALEDAILRHRAAERRQRRVLVGPQRDDVSFLLGGRPARAFASQGQARSLVLAWKIAELEVAAHDGDVPLFLLDDLGSELDPGRTARLVRLVRGLGAQVFVTTTDARFLPTDAGEVRVFPVHDGVVGPADAEGPAPG
jgi:DNA replication and repair protein RecF